MKITNTIHETLLRVYRTDRQRIRINKSTLHDIINKTPPFEVKHDTGLLIVEAVKHLLPDESFAGQDETRKAIEAITTFDALMDAAHHCLLGVKAKFRESVAPDTPGGIGITAEERLAIFGTVVDVENTLAEIKRCVFEGSES